MSIWPDVSPDRPIVYDILYEASQVSLHLSSFEIAVDLGLRPYRAIRSIHAVFDGLSCAFFSFRIVTLPLSMGKTLKTNQ